MWLAYVVKFLIYGADTVNQCMVMDCVMGRRKNRMVYYGSVIGVMLADYTLRCFLPHITLWPKTLLSLAFYYVMAAAAYRGRWWQKLYASMLAMALMCAFETLSAVLLTVILSRPVAMDINSSMSVLILTAVAGKAPLFATAFFIRRRKNGRQDDIGVTAAQWVSSALFPVITVFGLTALMNIMQQQKMTLAELGIIALCMLAANVAFIFLLDKIRDDALMLERKRYLAKELEASREDAAELIKLYGEQRHITHEFNRHLRTLAMCLECGENEKALEYIRSVTATMEADVPRIHCGSLAVDALLYEKQKQAQENNILFTLKLSSVVGMPFSEEEATVVFGNLLDNAVNACQKVEGERKIDLVINQRRGYLQVFVRNTSLPVTVVDDEVIKENTDISHGYGLKNVNDILKRHDSAICIDFNKGMFNAFFGVKLTGEEEPIPQGELPRE